MKTLISRLRDEGLSEQQIEKTFQTLVIWMDDRYPLAGAVTKSWLKKNWNEIKILKKYS